MGSVRDVRFTLHAHCSSGSADSQTPVEVLAAAYAERDIDVVGIVGHGSVPDIDTEGLPVEVLTGIEHELRKHPTRIHVVEFPEYDFRFLAHPRLTAPDGDLAETRALIDRLDVDAVEMFNRGSRHLSDREAVDVPVLANDDAHNTAQVATSYMAARVPRGTPQAVVDAARRGEVQLHNPGRGRFQHARGKLLQGLSLW